MEVLIPAAELPVDAPAPVTAPGGRAPSSTEGRTVLVVEDEAPVRRALRRMLERSGYRVLEAEDGSAAVERYGSADIDLLLTDLIMPGAMTGVDVVGSFRSRTSSLPVLYMSGYGADLLDGRGVDDHNGDAVLAKPFSEQDLITAVQAELGTP